MGISRACASKWVHRYREFGESDLLDRPNVPHRQPTAAAAEVVTRIEHLRREKKCSARRIALELANDGVAISVRTVSRHLAHLGLNRRRFLDPSGESKRAPRRIASPLARPHGPRRHQIGRPHPRRRRMACPRPRQRPRQDGRSQQKAGQAHRLRLSALDRRRLLPFRLHRSATRREGRHRSRFHQPRRGVLRRPRYRPVHPGGHRQRCLLPLGGVRPRPRRGSALVHPALHSTPQREGRVLQPDSGRGVPLRPRMDQRATPSPRARHLEHPLQLPSTPHCRREPAASDPTPHRRHQRHDLIQLVGHRCLAFGLEPGDAAFEVAQNLLGA